MKSSSRSHLRRARSAAKIAGSAVFATAMCAGVGVAVADPVGQPDQNQPGQNQPGAPAAPRSDRDFNAEFDRIAGLPIPADVDGLMRYVGDVSRLASEASDRVEQTKFDLDRAAKDLDAAKTAVDQTNRSAADIAVRVDGSRNQLSTISQAMYRGATIDPVSAVIGATGPQAAMERNAYLNSISDGKTRAVDTLQQELIDASKAQNAANRAKATADFQLRVLGDRKKDLEDRNAKLGDLKTRIKNTVDHFSPQDRRRWAEHNGPIDVNVKAFLDQIHASGTSGVVEAALSKLGSPYSWGAAGPDAFDCSGLMMWAYQQMGKTIPRTSSAQLAGGTPVSMDALQPGDIVGYYAGVTHVGMYIGDGKIVHASDYGIPVQVVPVNSMPAQGAVRY